MATRRLNCRHCKREIRFIGTLPSYCHHCGKELFPPAVMLKGDTTRKEAIESLTEQRVGINNTQQERS